MIYHSVYNVIMQRRDAAPRRSAATAPRPSAVLAAARPYMKSARAIPRGPRPRDFPRHEFWPNRFDASAGKPGSAIACDVHQDQPERSVSTPGGQRYILPLKARRTTC